MRHEVLRTNLDERCSWQSYLMRIAELAHTHTHTHTHTQSICGPDEEHTFSGSNPRGSGTSVKTKLVLYTTPLGERGGCHYSFLIYSVAILAQVLPFASGFMLLFFSGSTRAILLGLGALRTHSTIVPFGRGSSARLLSVYLLSTRVVVAAIIAAILGPVFSGSSLGRGRGLHGSAGARTATTTTTSCKQSAPLAETL